MRQRMKSLPLSACALTTALLVSACGGGSSSPPASATSSSGFAVDGYLSAATVLCDANSNGSGDTGEATVSTDSSGFFKFTPACSAPLVATGGTNVDTGLPFTGKLKAPTGSTVVSPLTTLLAEGMTSDQVAKSLGLPAGIDFSNTDPALAKDGAPVNADLLKKTLALQQLAQKTMEVFAKLATPVGAAASPAIYSEVMVGMAAEMRRGVVLVSGTTADESVVAALVKAASQRVGTSTILSTEVKAAASGVNADGLGKVMAGGLKVQIESILKSTSTSAGITAASKAAQSDAQIATFVDANKAMLASVPGAATATLGATLASQVIASMGGGSSAPVTPGPVTPAPTIPGTLLVSFDEATAAATGIGQYGGAAPSVEAGPAGGSGQALKILKPTSPETFGGTYFTVAAIPFTADRKKITARVYATRASAAIKFKVESANGGPAIEVEAAVPGAANTWQTVTWDLAGVDVTKTYTVVAITPDSALVTTGQAYYIDDITLAPAGAVTPPPPPPPPPPAPTSAVLVSFEEATPPGLIEFGTNGAGALIAIDPAGGTNKVAKVFKYIASEQWAGTTVATVGVGTTNAIATIPFSATNKTMTVRVYSPAVGVRVRLKVENAANGGITVETDAITTMAGAWETLSFNFANPGTNPPVGGGATAALNLANVYNKASLFFDFGLGNGGSGPLPADRVYYFDDLSFVTGSSGTVTPPPTPTPTSAVLVSFEEATPPGLIEFGTNGAGALIAIDPAGGTNKVAKVFKYIASEQWAGTTVATVGVGTTNAIATIPFSATNKTMTVRVYSPAVGVRVRLKVENAANGGITVETDAITTMAGAWETLSFNFANPGTNPPVGGGATAALNLANVYNKASLFFDFGLGNGGSGPLPADRVYYFDDLSFVN